MQGFDGAPAQGLALIGDDQAKVHADHTAKAAAGVARPERRIETEECRLRIGIAQVALGAMQAGGVAPRRAVVSHVDIQTAAASLEGELDGFHDTHFFCAGKAKAVGDHLQDLALAFIACLMHAGETAGGQPLGLLLFSGVGGQFDGKGEHQARVLRLLGARLQVDVDGLGRVVTHRLGRLFVKQLCRTGKQQLEVVVELGHRAHGAAAGAHGVGLVDGDGRWHPVDAVHRGAVHAVQKLPRVGTEGFYIAPLAFGIEGVKDQAGLARPAGAGDHGHLSRAQVQIEVFEVVLTRAAYADVSAGHGLLCRGLKGAEPEILGRNGDCRVGLRPPRNDGWVKRLQPLAMTGGLGGGEAAA